MLWQAAVGFNFLTTTAASSLLGDITLFLRYFSIFRLSGKTTKFGYLTLNDIATTGFILLC